MTAAVLSCIGCGETSELEELAAGVSVCAGCARRALVVPELRERVEVRHNARPWAHKPA